MRRLTLEALQSTMDAIFKKAPDNDGFEALQFQIQHWGTTCAAWLIFTERKRFHRKGTVEFKIPIAKVTPPWFRVAFEFLRTRDGWTATNRKTTTERVYTITWHSWSRGTMPHALRVVQ
jgi:hypothetical protein